MTDPEPDLIRRIIEAWFEEIQLNAKWLVTGVNLEGGVWHKYRVFDREAYEFYIESGVITLEQHVPAKPHEDPCTRDGKWPIVWNHVEVFEGSLYDSTTLKRLEQYLGPRVSDLYD